MLDLDKSRKTEEQLERRIRKLEDQMTILKNQIQNSLLEIQEILATRFYHTALRPADDGEEEDAPFPPARWEGYESGSGPQPGRQASVPRAQMQVAREPSDPVAQPPLVPKVKKVSLDDVRRSRRETASASSGSTATHNAPDNAFDLAAFAEMVHWVNTSTARVGAAYTREAIDDCLADGTIAPQVAEQLHQLIKDEPPGEMQDDVEPDEVVAVATELRTILNRTARS
jgi:hypothetical protein